MVWTKAQTFRNLISLLLVWIGTFTSYQALDVLQTSINGDFGIYSITLANICKLFSSFLGPLLMNKITPKWTVVLSCACMMTFTLANFYPVWYTLLPAGALIGLSQGPMWISHGIYVTVIGVEYSNLTNASKGRVLSRLSAFAASAIPIAMAIGNFLSSVMLKNVRFEDIDQHGTNYSELTTTNTLSVHYSVSTDQSDKEGYTDIVDDMRYCGPHFCPDLGTTSNQTDTVEDIIPDRKAFYLFLGVLTCFNIAAILLAIFGLDNLHKDQYRSKKATQQHCCRTTAAYIKSFFDWRFLLLTPTICYIFLFLVFLVGLFPRAYVTCSLGVDMIGYITMSRGIADFITCITLSLVAQKLPRSLWLFIASFVILANSVILLLWDLIEDERHTIIMLFVVSVLSGCCNSINMSQFPAFLGASFTEKKTEVFSFFQFSTGIISAVLFYSNIYICSATQLYLIIGFIPLGAASYIVLSCYLHRTSKKRGGIKKAEYERVALKGVVQKSDDSQSTK